MKELKEFSSEEEYVPRSIQYIVVHCSATRANIPFTEEQLLKCHLQRGFKCIGYHFYITRDGELHHCRPVSEPGAHVRGFNRHSIGICYEGGLDENGYPADTRTQAQRFTLLDLLTILRHQYPKAQILGHYQLSASIHKACPCFDCRKEYAELQKISTIFTDSRYSGKFASVIILMRGCGQEIYHYIVS